MHVYATISDFVFSAANFLPGSTEFYEVAVNEFDLSITTMHALGLVRFFSDLQLPRAYLKIPGGGERRVSSILDMETSKKLFCVSEGDSHRVSAGRFVRHGRLFNIAAREHCPKN